MMNDFLALNKKYVKKNLLGLMREFNLCDRDIFNSLVETFTDKFIKLSNRKDLTDDECLGLSIAYVKTHMKKNFVGSNT